MNRPAALFPLFAGLETLPGVGPKAAGLFPAMGAVSYTHLTLPTILRV